MNCLTTAWNAHAVELRGWLRHRTGNPALADDLRVAHQMIELPEDLVAQIEDVDTVDALTGCLPRVLSELSADDREAITLCDLQGMPQAEFAKYKGLSLSAAKSRVQRARVRLHAQMSVACRVKTVESGSVSDFVPRPMLYYYLLNSYLRLLQKG